MIVAFADIQGDLDHDVCIVGSGPIGLALALASAQKGLKVLVLESGQRNPSDFFIELGRAAVCPPTHASLTEANCRALGGTSHWWGGRCIPFDPIDFENREAVPSGHWPISYDEVARWYPEAAAFFQVGDGEFSSEGPWDDLKGIRIDQIERWCVPNMAVVHRQALEESRQITIVLEATVTGMTFSEDGKSVSALTVVNQTRIETLATSCVILAAGGVQTPRLLLDIQRRHPALFGGLEGPLGRYYMGHIFGKIANIVLKNPKEAAALDFFVDHDRYARRRFTLTEETQRQEKLLNLSFAAGNPAISDASHRSGALSLIWFALASPLGKRLLPDALLSIYVGKERRYGAHLLNIIRTLIPTMIAGYRIYRDKYIRKPGKPAVFLWNRGGRYSVHYHSEQTPEATNRLTLSEETDALGMRRLKIQFAYNRADAEKIVRAHEVLDRHLRDSNVGRLEFSQDREASIQSVLDQARDGMHEIGATRMSADPAQGVVDENCRVHDLSNLYIASTSVMPSSGNANPTFVGAALAIRLASHLAGLLRLPKEVGSAEIEASMVMAGLDSAEALLSAGEKEFS